jgi:hypothetical protein
MKEAPLVTDSHVLRRVLVVAVVGAVVLVCAGTAPAQVVSVTATATPRLVSFPTTRSAEFGLTLVTGADAASVSVEFLKPHFGHGRAGWTLGIDELGLEGPGRLRRRPPIHIELFDRPCIRGYASGLAAAGVEQIPANSTTTLVVPARLASGSPPWADTSYRLGFKVRERGRKPIRVVAAHPGRSGPQGVRIGIHVRAPWRDPQEPSARPGTPITVMGGTRPRLAHHRIAVRLHQMPFDSTRSTTTLRRLLTDSAGNYRTVFTPQQDGQYTVATTLRPQPGEPLVRDVSCPKGFALR